METNTQELIKKMKAVKQQRKISYNELMKELTVNDVPIVAMTTLRRVFAEGSEDKASSFNYEKTLLPIAQAMKKIAGCPDESHYEEEIENLNGIIESKSSEIKRMESQIASLAEQMDKKDDLVIRLIDRLDQKDAIIKQLLIDMKQKDEIVRQLMDKCLI